MPGLIAEEREAGFTYFRVPPVLTERNSFGPLWTLLQTQFEAADATAMRRGRQLDP